MGGTSASRQFGWTYSHEYNGTFYSLFLFPQGNKEENFLGVEGRPFRAREGSVRPKGKTAPFPPPARSVRPSASSVVVRPCHP